MLETGLFILGQTDLPIRRTEAGRVLPTGTLKDMHESFQRITAHQVAEGVLAEKLGYDYLWGTEHHFQSEGAEFSPNPIATQLAIAGQTSRIRLGQYANILTWQEPIRLAEQAAMLDVISGGRVEFGIGRGYQSRETETLGRSFGATIQDQERNRVLFDEAYEVIMKAWTQPSFSHHGETFSIPPRHTKWHHDQTNTLFSQPGMERTLDQVVDLRSPDMYASGSPVTATGSILKEISVFPQPLQKPHPQIWMPLTSERSIRLAARNGWNGGFIVEPTWLIKKNVDVYYDEAQKQGWPDYKNRGQFKYGWDAEKKRGILVLRWVHVTKDPNNPEVRDRIDRGFRAGWSYYGPFGFVTLLANPGEKMDINTIAGLDLLTERGAAYVGTPEHVAEQIIKLKEDLGFDDFNFGMQLELAGYTAEERIEQFHLFAEEVLPILRREMGGSPWDAARVNGRALTTA